VTFFFSLSPIISVVSLFSTPLSETNFILNKQKKKRIAFRSEKEMRAIVFFFVFMKIFKVTYNKREQASGTNFFKRGLRNFHCEKCALPIFCFLGLRALLLFCF